MYPGDAITGTASITNQIVCSSLREPIGAGVTRFLTLTIAIGFPTCNVLKSLRAFAPEISSVYARNR